MPRPEPTKEQAFVLRRAAYILQTTDLADYYPETAQRLTQAADECEAPQLCEGCERPAVRDYEDISLCGECEESARADS